jgi:hypothetical protein
MVQEAPMMGAMYKPTSLGVNGLVSPQNLPKIFDQSRVKKQKLENCSLCRVSISGMFAKKHFNCTMCGCSCCQMCSQFTMALSQVDKKEYRVCN